MAEGRRTAERRWLEHHIDAYDKFLGTSEYAQLKRRGLELLGRSTQVKVGQWLSIIRGVDVLSAEWQSFDEECRDVGKRLGLDRDTVQLGCLIDRYRPERFDFPLEASPPTMTLVFDGDTKTPFFINVLRHAADVGLTVSSKAGRFPPAHRGFVAQGSDVIGRYPLWEETEITSDQRPPLATAFKVRLEFPPVFPPELAVEWTRSAVNAQNELARRLGYPVRLRLRRRRVSQKD